MVTYYARSGGLEKANGRYERALNNTYVNGNGCILYQCSDCGPALNGWGINCDGLATYTTKGCYRAPYECHWYAKASRKAREPAPIITTTKPERERWLQQLVDAEGWRLLAKVMHAISNGSLAPLRSSESITGEAQQSILNERSTLFAGDSAMRKLYASMTRHEDGEEGREIWDNVDGFSIESHGCDPSIGSGCDDCWACCSPQHCNTALNGLASHSFKSWRKRLETTNYLRQGWLDYTHHHKTQHAQYMFSWKPEIYTRADRMAFAARFCNSTSPPHFVYLGKGLHDACRHNGSDLTEFASLVEERLHALTQVLRCLPPTSIIVLRTPYMVPRPGLSASRVCRTSWQEPARVQVVRDTLQQMHRAGSFGSNALLLDMYALTRAAMDSDVIALHTVDGHHYPPGIIQVEHELLLYAFSAALSQFPQQHGRGAARYRQPNGRVELPLPGLHWDHQASDDFLGTTAAKAYPPSIFSNVQSSISPQVHTTASSRSPTRIVRPVCAVVISAAPHVPLIPRVVHSILVQTLKPIQVVVALSGVVESECAAVRATLHSLLLPAAAHTSRSQRQAIQGDTNPMDAALFTPEWRLLCTREARSSGQNRNAAAAACSTFAKDDEYISFMDSDDMMLPRRLETMVRLMDAYNATIGLHSWLTAAGTGAPGCCAVPPIIINPNEAHDHFMQLHSTVDRRCVNNHFKHGCTFGGNSDSPVSRSDTHCRLHDECTTCVSA